MSDDLHPIPESWVWTRVEDAGSVQLGRQRSPQHHSGEHMRPYLRVANVYENRIDTRDVLQMNFTPAEAERYLLSFGDILLNEGQSRELVGRPAMFRNEVPGACFQNTLVRFKAWDFVDPRYALSLFRYYFHAGHFQNVCKWTTNIAHLGADRFASMPFPLAPLPEQKRIADKLDALLARVDACRGRLDRVPGILKRFRQSVLAAATSGELTREWREERGLLLGWQKSTLGAVGDVTGGITKNAARANTSLMRRYLRVANVYANRLTLEDVSEIATTPEEFARTRLRAGDVLIVEGNGSVEQIGRAALWRGEIDECAHQNHLIRWRTRGSVMPEFALYWLLSPAGRESLVEFAKSSAGLHTLSLSKVSAVPLLMPALDEQAEVVRRVGELFQMAERLERRLTEAQARIVRTTPSVLAKAFRGELVLQDPNDEPTSNLLARLRTRPASAGDTGKPKRGGTRGSRTKARADTNIHTRKDVAPTHLTTILKERGPLTAEALWTASQLEIDDFYDQLKDEEARGLLRESRGDLPHALRLLEPAA